MTKFSTASARIPTQLPSQSPWAKGPPPNSNSSAPSSRSQSPAPSHVPSPIAISHTRRPSALGQGVPIKEGVSVPRNNVGSVRQGSAAVTFGSIDETLPPLSSSPVATPVVKTENVKSFGSVSATPATHVNGNFPVLLSNAGPSKLPARLASSSTSSMTSPSITSTTSSSATSASAKPTLNRADIAKLFQGSLSQQPSSDTSSPSTQPSNLPPHHQPSLSGQHPLQPPGQPSQLGARQFAQFVPGMRPQQGADCPRSPAIPRAVPNGTDAPPRAMVGPGGPGGPPIPASPRLAPSPRPSHPHQPPAIEVPAQQVPIQPMPLAPYYYPIDAYGHQQPHTPHSPASETQAKKEEEAQRKEERYHQQPHATTHTAVQGGTGDPAIDIKDTQSLCDDRYSDADRAALSETPANRWIVSSVVRRRCTDHIGYPDLVERKVRALLNKLTWEKFDSISDQTIAWANKSENERDAKTLNQVIRVVYEQLTHELAFIEIYARLCRKMMERISPEVQDDGIRNTEGKPIAGGQLIRKYLLNRCQDDFERGWVAQEATNLDECYAAQKAKRQGLGVIKFIGELFKLRMLTERIMHECVKKLLVNVENPKEEEIESLCELLKTVGQQLDVPKARAHMDVYFTRMKGLFKSPNVSPRLQFMLQDVIELRDRKWAARGIVVVPTTLSAVHEAALREKAIAEAQSYQRQLSVSRGGSRRGDLSQFGKISKGAGAPMVMGHSSVFTKKDPNIKRDSLSRMSSSPNVFSMLGQNPKLVVDITKSSRLPGQNPLMDLGQGGAPEPIQRKKRQLLPRTKPTSADPPASEDEAEVPDEMSEADAKKKIDEDVKEFFAIRSMEEADVYFSNLPEEHRFHLVDKLVGSALESKEADAVLVSEFFAQASSKGQCSFEVFETGFMPMAELLDDIAIDAPNAFKFMAIMLKGAGFDREEERLAGIVGKSMDGDKLLQLVGS